MSRRLFFRCNGGHYFQGRHCPYDGWTTDGIDGVVEHFERTVQSGREVSIDSLRAATSSGGLTRRILLIEFGDEDAIFDAIVPERYVYKGRDILWKDTGESLN